MAERTEGSIEIEASPPEIMEAITDFDAYPEWAEGIRSAEVRSRDDEGRPTEVAFEFSSMGLDASYTLTYEYEGDARIRWTTKEASGSVKDIQGEYELEALNGDTEVSYRLAIEPAIRVPGFLKRRGEKQALQVGLEGLKKRVERG
jgi:ribosome-associated toxin RatA of RatAB toxin-antitoxin module